MESKRDITFENSINYLLQQFPELSDKYTQELEYWAPDKPGEHIVYGDMFIPYIKSAIASGDQQAINRVLKLIEELSSSSDKLVQEIVAFTIIEYFVGSPEFNIIKQNAGPNTTEIIKDVTNMFKKIGHKPIKQTMKLRNPEENQ